MQAQPLSRNSSFSGNLKGAKSVSDIEMLKHAADPDDDRQVIRLPRPCSRQNNGSRSTTDMPRSVSFSDETGRHRTRQPTLSPASSQHARIDGWQPQPYQASPHRPPLASDQLCNGMQNMQVGGACQVGGGAAGGTRGVFFQVLAETRWGDTLVLVGSLPQLGAWDPTRGVPLVTDAASYPTWRLPAAQVFAVGQLCEFKFVIKRAPHDGQPCCVEWEELPDNRRLQLGAEAPAELRLEMSWGTPRTLAWRRTSEARPVPHVPNVSETPATFHAASFHAAPSPLGRGGQSIFGQQFHAAGAAAISTAFPSFGGVAAVAAAHTAGGSQYNQYSRASSMISIASSMGGEDHEVEIPLHYPRAKPASRQVSALDLGASLLSPEDSP